MQREYWHRAHRHAFRATGRQLLGENLSTFTIRAVIAVFGIALLWLFVGKEIASHESLVMLSTIGVVALLFPAFYVFHLITAPAKMQAEAEAKIEQLEQRRATLTVNGPRIFRDPHYKTYTRWRMKVHNAGPAAASNVQMKLRSGKSEPRDPSWASDYPYPINRVGHTPDEICQINPDDDEDYEIVLGLKSEGGGQYFATIDTKSHGHSQIQIQPDERWEFSYEVTATNAPAVRFALQFFLGSSDEFTVVRVP